MITIGFTTGFELQRPLTLSLQLNIFLWHECYLTSCMNCNDCNSSHVKPHTYTTHAIQLQLCKNNYHTTPMQLVCNYCCNVILMLFYIHPSMMNFVDFHYNCGCGGNIWMVATNWQLCDNSRWHKVILVCNHNVPNLKMAIRWLLWNNF